jgi:hypothetical protein
MRKLMLVSLIAFAASFIEATLLAEYLKHF